jgi:AraC family transcriptional regulator
MNHRYESRLVRRIVVHGCTLHEFDYAPGVRVRRGPAAQPSLTITLAGCAMESDSAGVVPRRLMTCAFAPASSTSVAHVSEEGWRVLVVGLGDAWALDAVRHLDLRTPCSCSGGWTYKLCERLYHEFGSGDQAAAVAIEGLVVQIAAEVARAASSKRERRPAWLDAVRSFIDANFRAQLRLPELARDARVHPAHLSKTFTRVFGCTIGEYVRGRRVDFARRQIETSALTLSEIAIAAGFADQSHFTKTFKRVVGTSPSEYRHAARPAAAADAG